LDRQHAAIEVEIPWAVRIVLQLLVSEAAASHHRDPRRRVEPIPLKLVVPDHFPSGSLHKSARYTDRQGETRSRYHRTILALIRAAPVPGSPVPLDIRNYS